MKKCKYCKTEIDKDAKICPNCKKKQSSFSKKLGIVLGIFIVIIGIVAFSNGSNNKDNDDDNKCYITLDKFNKIQSGMSYNQVKEIVGCEGTVVSESEYMGTKMTIYSWYGKDGISNANINIENDKLLNKSQIGLK